MKIPKKLTIGKYQYDIKQVKIVDWSNTSVSGSISYYNKRMKIQKSKDPRLVEDVFFHEMSHGVLKELEYNHPKAAVFRNNEAFVQEMGLILRKTFIELLEAQEDRK